MNCECKSHRTGGKTSHREYVPGPKPCKKCGLMPKDIDPYAESDLIGDLNLADFDGHTPGPWFEYPASEWGRILMNIGPMAHNQSLPNHKDAKLIAAAPDLLAEVKRLQAIIDKAERACLEVDRTEGADGNLERIVQILLEAGLDD